MGTLPPHQGGSAIVGYQLLSGFARAGHLVRALAPVTPETERQGKAFDASYPEINIRRFLMPHFELPPHFPYSDRYVHLEQKTVQKQLTRLMGEDRTDVVLIGRETYARYVPDLANIHGIPCILIIHGGLTHGIMDGTHDPEFIDYLLSQYRKADLVVTPSRHMAANLERLGIAVTVISNCVNMKLFSPARKGNRLR